MDVTAISGEKKEKKTPLFVCTGLLFENHIFNMRIYGNPACNSIKHLSFFPQRYKLNMIVKLISELERCW